MDKRATGQDIVTSPTSKGTFVAATECSPYLCVEAGTEDEALKIAARALAFYRSVSQTPSRASEPMQVSSLVVSRRVSSEALAAA